VSQYSNILGIATALVILFGATSELAHAVQIDQQTPNLTIKKILNYWSEGKITNEETINFINQINEDDISIQGATLSKQNMQEPFLDSDSITYVKPNTKKSIHLESLPKWAQYDTDVVSDAIKFWKDKTGAEFYITSSAFADIELRWVKEIDKGYDGYIVAGKFIDIAVGNSNCGETWKAYDSKTVTLLVIHELGHALGIEHSTDENSIMYPFIANPKYETIDTNYSLENGGAVFIPGCTFGYTTSYVYDVKINNVDDNAGKIDMFFVPSQKEYYNYLKGEEFQFYSDKSCYELDVKSQHTNLCNKVGKGGGMLIAMPDDGSSHKMQIQVQILEK